VGENRDIPLGGFAVMPATAPMTSSVPIPGQQTVAQYFQSKKLVMWWVHPTQRYGQNGEQGTDFGLQLNTPVGSITPGRVVYSAYSGDASLGYIVQIQTATGQLLHYQHLATSIVKTGQSVSVGQVIGNSGGVAGQYSTGPHIEVRFSQTFNPTLATGTGIGGSFWSDGQWVDSLPTINTLTGQPGGANGAPPPTSGLLPGLSSLFAGLLGFANTSTANLPTSASFTLPNVHIAPTGDVTNFLVALDAFLEVVNPFNVTNASQDTILGATFTDPISWIEGFGYNVFADLGAVTWRLFFIVFGGYLVFKVSNHFINYQALASSATKAVALGAML
jgi:murein DD-endopeptidase MepM/ murein hydrolase activator NlpD